MGHTSEELKKVAGGEWPVDGVDYYITRVSNLKPAPYGWIMRHSRRGYFFRARIVRWLQETKDGHRKPQPGGVHFGSADYYLVLGDRPNKKWGPVCP